MNVIYLHGFLSSPRSSKAQQTIAWCQQSESDIRLHVPELDDSPAGVIASLQDHIDQHRGEPLALIGSSLGGYYATCLAERNQLPAALINPAVRPYERWREFIGEHRNYYSTRVHTVTEQHVRELQDLDHEPLQFAANYLLLVQTGDEVLDYRMAIEKYRGSTCLVQEGGDHSFQNYADLLPTIFDFFALQKCAFGAIK